MKISSTDKTLLSIAIAGAGGMLGSDIATELKKRNLPCHALKHSDWDVTSLDACYNVLSTFKPEVVINCAAYTDVDKAEVENDLAMMVNSGGSRNLAQACADRGIRLIHVSTDYVFDGEKRTPYETTDAYNPINVYGRSKVKGEQAVVEEMKPDSWAIVRTSWLYGKNGPNFVNKVLTLAHEGKNLNVTSTQKGAPTYTVDLARTIADLAVIRASGIYHATGSGSCTRFEFAREILTQAGIPLDLLEPCLTQDYPALAARPADSRLSMQSLKELGIELLPDWQDGLRRYLASIGEFQS